MAHDPKDETDTIDEADASPEEIAQAEALARALDTGERTLAMPEDALAAGMLIRYGEGAGVLAEDRRRALRDELVKGPAVAPAKKKRGVLLLFPAVAVPAGILAAAAAVLLVVLTARESAPPSTIATSLPAPDATLLRAQLRAASNEEGADAELTAAMRGYRGQLFAALEDRYSR